ncbi:MAG TPA: hypothetical protein VLF42_08305 [Burkholderiales bacterium]|nr:hypothetical protein [Burkholderiales bacterium]
MSISRTTRSFVIAAYAALGFDGLAHYALAPFADHSATMHLTIGLEAAAAASLLAAVVVPGILKELKLGA